MPRRREAAGAPTQGDLFGHEDLFPVRWPRGAVRAVDQLRIKTAMGVALKECPDSAVIVAARMSEMTGREITADALYAFTAPSKTDHDIGITRFVAFVRATGAAWLWDVLVHDDGLTVMEGREARLAQLGLMRQERGQIDKAIRAVERELGEKPVKVSACRRRSPVMRGKP